MTLLFNTTDHFHRDVTRNCLHVRLHLDVSDSYLYSSYMHHAFCRILCPANAQYVLTIPDSFQTFTQQALQIRIEPTRKTVPDSVVYIATHLVTMLCVL
jgi:hypothetical protein